jgi:hypothetical protein
MMCADLMPFLPGLDKAQSIRKREEAIYLVNSLVQNAGALDRR